MIKIKNILVPTDFSERFMITLDYALVIAKSIGSVIHIIHVIEPAIYPTEIFVTNYGFDKLPNEFEVLAQNDINKIVSKLEEMEVKYKTQILHGKPFEEILSYAHKNHIDLICIPTLGHSNLENMFFGSTTEKIIRKAYCPVLTVRIHEEEEE